MGKCTDSKKQTWETYQDARGKWRWSCTASNGEIVGASTQGYVNKADCIANAKTNGCTCNLS
jgi:uncharacterized protein YegP (UPF0339 family)